MTSAHADAAGRWLAWQSWDTRFIFFTGKGGVGKTTVAAAVAVALADSGQRVLVVSTDPASNLDDVLAVAIGQTPTGIPGVDRLSAMNIDPAAATSAYRERVIAPYRGAVPQEELRAIEEQLAGQCTVEIAAFDEFARIVADPERTSAFDRVLFDTAPTGHTLRLLSLPQAWTGFIDTTPSGASCLGPLAGLQAKREEYAATVRVLSDPMATTLALVARADPASLAEAARAGDELIALGIARQRLVVNAVLTDPLAGDDLATGFARRQRAALDAMPASLAPLPRAEVPLVASDLTGPEALRALTQVHQRDRGAAAPRPAPRPPEAFLPLADLVAQLAAGGRGAVLVMGKGGVGKTSIAVSLAVELARLGHQVHLSTTDPAGDPSAIVGARPPTLEVGRIDPSVEVARYAREKLELAGNADPARRQLLEEDLRSPCTQEIAVFQAFSRLLREARDRFVILDTAPTGHTLLLLDTTGAYHRDVLRLSRDRQGLHVSTPLMWLQDPTKTRLLIVTLAEATPVQEAAELQDDLRRAGIEPYGWIVNASLTGSATRDPVLACRAGIERLHLGRVAGQLASRAWLVPWRPDA